MTDTFVDGKVQRTQVILYAKVSNEPEIRFKQLSANRKTILPRARMRGNSHIRFGSGGMGKHASRKAGRCALSLP